MSTSPLLFGILLAAPLAIGINYQALAPDRILDASYRGSGRHRPLGAPEGDAPQEFRRRVRSRERLALAASIVLALAGVFASTRFGPGTPEWSVALGALAACTGRALAIAIASGREAFGARSASGPRVSRGHVPRFGEVVPLAPWIILTIGTLLFLLEYLPPALRLLPESRIWIIAAAAISVAFLAIGWALARWLIGQPQLASSAREAGWAAALRRRDATALLILGPIWAFGVTVAAYDGGDPIQPLAGLSWAFVCLLALFGLAMGLADRYRTVAHR